MRAPETLIAPISRREALQGIAAAIATVSLASDSQAQDIPEREKMTILCIIRYQIDPFQKDAFKKYAETLIAIIPRCGGHLVGYFLPHEGTNDIAWGLIALDSLASYETYRARLKSDPDFREAAAMMQSKRIILREERNFVELVEGTFNLPAKV